VIRLVASDSVEEYILKIAAAKLRLTRSVLASRAEDGESGACREASHPRRPSAVGTLSAAELSDLLTFGLAALRDADAQDAFADQQLPRLVGASSPDGRWLPFEPQVRHSSFLGPQLAPPSPSPPQGCAVDAAKDDFLDYGGESFRRKRRPDDEAALRALLPADTVLSSPLFVELNGSPRVGSGHFQASPLSPEELEKRKQEAAARRARLLESRRKRRVAEDARRAAEWKQQSTRARAASPGLCGCSHAPFVRLHVRQVGDGRRRRRRGG